MTYNGDVVAAAERVCREALADVISHVGRRYGVVVRAVAGAGKSYFVTSGVGSAREQGLRVAVCAPTNEQAFGLVRSLATRYPHETVTFIPAQGIQLPEATAQLANVVEARPARAAKHAGLIVGTFDKLGDAYAREDLSTRELLFVDESFQADSARYYAVAGLAPTHLLVGDGGQLDPFTTIDEPERWRGLPEDPLQTSVGVLLRNHPSTPVHQLPISRRLDPRAVPIAQSFYPGHGFEAAVLPDVRELRLLRGVAHDQRTRLLDAALDRAARGGWAHLELPEAAVLTADPETLELIVDLVRRLRDRAPEVRCELRPEFDSLLPHRIAIGVSHNDQKDLLRIALDGAGLPDVVVNTANKLQGLEFDLVIAWHPLAGLPDTDGFHLDPGRLCVLLTRHRHGCIVIGRAGDRALLDGLPPSTPAYFGWDPDPVLDGWEAHQTVFERLEPHRLAA